MWKPYRDHNKFWLCNCWLPNHVVVSLEHYLSKPSPSDWSYKKCHLTPPPHCWWMQLDFWCPLMLIWEQTIHSLQNWFHISCFIQLYVLDTWTGFLATLPDKLQHIFWVVSAFQMEILQWMVGRNYPKFASKLGPVEKICEASGSWLILQGCSICLQSPPPHWLCWIHRVGYFGRGKQVTAQTLSGILMSFARQSVWPQTWIQQKWKGQTSSCLCLHNGFHKSDPPTLKMLLVEADVPEFLVGMGQMPVTSPKPHAVDDLCFMVFYFLWQVGEYTVNGLCNSSKQTEQFETECQILVGILQNSEFCQKLLPIRPEPHSDVLFFYFY